MNIKYNFLFVGVSLCFSLIFFSCKTTPSVPEKPVVVEEDLAKEAKEARSQAIASEADKKLPELFAQAEAKLGLGNKTAKTNREEAIKVFAEATQMYKILKNLADSLQAKEELDSLNFPGIDKEKYKKAEELYKAAIENYGSDLKTSLDDALRALALYNEMCDVAYAELVKNAKEAAKEAKDRCDSIKASRSMAKPYNEAVQHYNNGTQSFKEKRNRMAYKEYMASCDLFNSIYKTAQDKRKEAEEALARARAKMRESSSLASEADKASPLKDGADGFGDVDSSSLENKDSEEQEVDEIKE